LVVMMTKELDELFDTNPERVFMIIFCVV